MGFFGFGVGYFGQAQPDAVAIILTIIHGTTRFISGFKRSTRREI